jgi:glycosyltransferase involved in cell wall biosynthesis
MKISVIIPTYNDESTLEECLNSLGKQTRDFELIIVDGHSSDRTVDMAKKHGAQVVYEDYGTRGGACNVGAEEASGDIVVFTDADAAFPPDWLEKVERKFEETGADVVGGDDIIKEGTNFEKALFAIDKAQEPPSKGEIWKRVRGCNSAYRREVFLENKFDPVLKSIEESELHYRLKEKGHKMVFDQKIVVYHHRRRSFGALARQFFRNGKGRAQVIRKRSEMLDFGRDLAPLGLFFFLIFSLIGSIWIAPLLLGALGVLFVVFVLLPLNICRKSRDWWAFWTLMLAFPVRWFSFSLGYLRGVI